MVSAGTAASMAVWFGLLPGAACASMVCSYPAEDGRGGTDAIQRAEDEEALEQRGGHRRRAAKHSPRAMPRNVLILVAGKTSKLRLLHMLLHVK